MESLDLSHNPISINGVQSLAECLHNVVSLNIDTCKFDSVHFEIIARYLLKTNHRVSLNCYELKLNFVKICKLI